MRRVVILVAALAAFLLPWVLDEGPLIDAATATGTSNTPGTAPPGTAPPGATTPAFPAYTAGSTTSPLSTVSTGAATPASRPARIGVASTVTATREAFPNGGIVSQPAVEYDDYWTFLAAGIPESFAEKAVALDGVTAVIEYTAGTMHLVSSQRADGTVVDQPPRGWFIPLDGAVITPEELTTYLGVDLGLGPDDIVLGVSSARLRRLQVGDTITFERGATLRVGAIVPDDLFGESEMIGLSLDHFVASRFVTRAALVRTDGSLTEPELREALSTVYPKGASFGLHARNATPDGGPRVVRSWVFIKQVFGEFSYRPRGGIRVQIEQAWIDENIVEVNIPLLGRTKCHKKYAKVLTDVMNQLSEDGFGSIINRRTFYGCWNPRYIRGTTRLSRHAVGLAADLNFSGLTGDRRGSPVHSELLAAMAENGVHSGHVWSNPDPGHFEYYGFPDLTPDVRGPR